MNILELSINCSIVLNISRPFIFGFGSASVLWFLTLSTVVSLLGGRFNEKVLNIINKVCGAVIIFYGCKLLWSFVKLMGWL